MVVVQREGCGLTAVVICTDGGGENADTSNNDELVAEMVVVVVDEDNSSTTKAVVARMIREHDLFELCRRRRNFDEPVDCKNDTDGGNSILITFPSTQPSLQLLEK